MKQETLCVDRTAAEGWIYDAIAFWERQMPESARMQNRQEDKGDRRIFL